jgi:L-amino acid N-acyltransferase YncA
MTIRPARDEDFSAIASITNHYIETTSIHFASEPVRDDDLRAHWRSSRDRHPFLVVEEVGRVVAYAKSSTWRERAAYSWTAETGLYVTHDARGRGLGKPLYAALLDEMERRGFRSAVAGIALPNDASIALHRALGFERVGVFRDAGWKMNAWHDVEWWQKRFKSDPLSAPL